MSAAAHPVTLLPGDGIGPEVTEAVVDIFAAAGAPVAWERAEAGAAARRRHGTALPAATLDAIRRTGVALKGRLAVGEGGGAENPNVALRKVLDLYANVRPVRSFPGRASRWPALDLLVVRENTEGEYAGLEHQVVPGVVESIKVTTERACTRIARFAFERAARQGRRKVTAVHKANIMKRSDGLFLACCRTVARDHPGLEYQELIVDNACMQLVVNPLQFDVMVMQNFYGDLVSDLCAGLVGGIGVVPGVNHGDGIVVFEAIHGDAPHLAGTGRANPMPLLVAALALLRHLGFDSWADRITGAVADVLREARHVTPDLGGDAGTREMTEAIVARLPADG
jgi:isocitrate dehydrogenase (NAD+)